MSEMTTPYPLPPLQNLWAAGRGDVDTHRGCTACEGGHVGTELCHCDLGEVSCAGDSSMVQLSSNVFI